MKKVGLFFLVGALVVGAGSKSAFALPDVSKRFLEVYKDNADVIAASKEAKCNVCHFGKSKKNRNDYGKALSKYINKDEVKKKKAEGGVEEYIDDGLKKAEADKSTGGGTFGDLLKAGKLPGTAPEE
jgi:hypothetical protein